MISEITASAIKGKAEFAFLREEFILTEEIKPVICNGGATSTLSSLHRLSTQTVEIMTAEVGVIMVTTHVCMKTYYVKSRTGEIRPIVTRNTLFQH